MLFVAPGLDLRLGRLLISWGCVAAGIWGPGLAIGILWGRDASAEAFLLFFLGNGLASLLVGELGVTRLSAPAVGYLLWVVAEA